MSSEGAHQVKSKPAGGQRSATSPPVLKANGSTRGRLQSRRVLELQELAELQRWKFDTLRRIQEDYSRHAR